MNIEGFLELLPIARGRGWHITSAGLLRDVEGRCPICAVIHEIDPQSQWREAVGEAAAEFDLPMRKDSMLRIVLAADVEPGPPSCANSSEKKMFSLRAKMCEILEVEE